MKHLIYNLEGAFEIEVPDQTEEEIAAEKERNDRDYENGIRVFRNSLLAESDWTQLLNAPLSTEKINEWSIYRQSLRDITLHANWPHLEHTDWPINPNGFTGIMEPQ